MLTCTCPLPLLLLGRPASPVGSNPYTSSFFAPTAAANLALSSGYMAAPGTAAAALAGQRFLSAPEGGRGDGMAVDPSLLAAAQRQQQQYPSTAQH